MAETHHRRGPCSSKARVTAHLLLSFLALSTPATYARASQDAPQNPIIPPRIPETSSQSLSGEQDFTLRHVFHHGTHLYPKLHRRLDVPPDTSILVAGNEDGEIERLPRLRTRSRGLQIQRLSDREPSTIDDYLSEARYTGEAVTLSPDSWVMDEIPGPNVTDKETVLNFAIMTANDYNEHPGEGDWIDLGPGPFNYSQNFGWEGDGLRGHIYADEGNKTIVISIKGTSPAVFDGSGTTTNDKENDNLFFSCCCGQGGNYFWRQVCDCYQTTYTCNQTCLVKSLKQPNRYYSASIELYTNVTALYPDSNVWLAGHSLGGATASLLGLTFGLPVVTFEAVPEALPASRLGLPVPPGYNSKAHQQRDSTGAFHFGHTADPIYMGTCNGATAVCTLGGYAMESQCHTGHRCVYDTVEDKGWRVGAGTHSIQNVIKDVIRTYNSTPVCTRDTECADCFLWKFPESNGTKSSTSSSSSSTSTRTRTSTCKTPGWWGCLDETTTTTTTTSTSTTSTSTTITSSCHTPGWFGCKDPTTTTSSTSSPGPSSSTAAHTPAPTMTTTRALSSTKSRSQSHSTHTTCETPGFFWGCHDAPRTTASSRSSSGPSPTSTSSKSHHKHQECSSKAWFGLICRDPSTSHSTTVTRTNATPKPTSKPPHERPKRCVKRSWWFGRCVVWEWDPDTDNPTDRGLVEEL